MEIDPNYPDARAFRVIVYNAEGNVEAACSEQSALIALEPPDIILQLISGLGLTCA